MKKILFFISSCALIITASISSIACSELKLEAVVLESIDWADNTSYSQSLFVNFTGQFNESTEIKDYTITDSNSKIKLTIISITRVYYLDNNQLLFILYNPSIGPSIRVPKDDSVSITYQGNTKTTPKPTKLN